MQAAIFCALGFGFLLAIPASGQQTSGSSGRQAPAAASKLPRGAKLVMKDGTSHTVSSYTIQGGRVRYFSTERAEWEEVPASMVDWSATKKAALEAAQQEQALDEKVKAQEAAEQIAPLDVDASLEILPGVFLPPGEGVFILDGRGIFPLHASAATSKLSKKHLIEQVITPIPIVPSQRSIDLPGAHASFRITNASPEFYLRTTDPVEPEVELIQAKVHGGKRHIEDVDTLFTQQKEKRKTVPIQAWEVAKGVYRFTLGQPLKPGEYVLAEVSAKEGMNLLVWDFGVDRARGHGAKNAK